MESQLEYLMELTIFNCRVYRFRGFGLEVSGFKAKGFGFRVQVLSFSD